MTDSHRRLVADNMTKTVTTIVVLLWETQAMSEQNALVSAGGAQGH
jgi:hypothetical protein